jgi:hypothetical protein
MSGIIHSSVRSNVPPSGTLAPAKIRTTVAPSVAAASIQLFTIATSRRRASASGTAKSLRTPVPQMVTPLRNARRFSLCRNAASGTFGYPGK